MGSFGGVEAGGTKFVCGIGTGPDDVRTATFPTTTPQETIGRVVEFFRAQEQPVNRIGIASFGPVDLVRSSPMYGFITSTPKPGWRSVDLAGAIQRALGAEAVFDTDVNGAILAETKWGAARGLSDALYLTVGTGIGGGAIVGGSLVHGMLHPEMGHIRVPHDWAEDPFKGSCPFHGDCLEGLACGLALEQRWGVPAAGLDSSHPAWELEARYLAYGLANWVCTLSPQRIVIGGGVMRNPDLIGKVRCHLQTCLNGYIQTPQMLTEMESYVVPPGLGDCAGVLGAIALAQR